MATEPMGVTFSGLDAKILNALASWGDGWHTSAAIATFLRVPSTRVLGRLRALEADGVVQHGERMGPSILWRLARQ